MRYECTIYPNIYCTNWSRRWRPVTITFFKFSGTKNKFCHFWCRCTATSVYYRSSVQFIFWWAGINIVLFSSLFQYKNNFCVYSSLVFKASILKCRWAKFFSKTIIIFHGIKKTKGTAACRFFSRWKWGEKAAWICTNYFFDQEIRFFFAVMFQNTKKNNNYSSWCQIDTIKCPIGIMTEWTINHQCLLNNCSYDSTEEKFECGEKSIQDTLLCSFIPWVNWYKHYKPRKFHLHLF